MSKMGELAIDEMNCVPSGEPIDVEGPSRVQIVIRQDGKTLWVNVNGICLLRASQVQIITIDDQRKKEVVTNGSISQKEKKELQAKGYWGVKERCDNPKCVNIIGPLSWRGKADRVFCSEICRDTVEHNPTKRKKREAGETKTNYDVKTKVARSRSGAEKLLGVAPIGTTLANILTTLSDEKWHTKESLSKCKVKADDSVGWRLTLLQRAGSSAERKYELELVGDKARLTFTGKALKTKDLESSKDEQITKSMKTKDLGSDNSKLIAAGKSRHIDSGKHRLQLQNASKSSKAVKFNDAPAVDE